MDWLTSSLLRCVGNSPRSVSSFYFRTPIFLKGQVAEMSSVRFRFWPNNSHTIFNAHWKIVNSKPISLHLPSKVDVDFLHHPWNPWKKKTLGKTLIQRYNVELFILRCAIDLKPSYNKIKKENGKQVIWLAKPWLNHWRMEFICYVLLVVLLFFFPIFCSQKPEAETKTSRGNGARD